MNFLQISHFLIPQYLPRAFFVRVSPHLTLINLPSPSIHSPLNVSLSYPFQLFLLLIIFLNFILLPRYQSPSLPSFAPYQNLQPCYINILTFSISLKSSTIQSLHSSPSHPAAGANLAKRLIRKEPRIFVPLPSATDEVHEPRGTKFDLKLVPKGRT